jgi:hypothetical protein
MTELYFCKLSRFIFLGCLLGIMAVASLHLLVPQEVSMFIAYLLPIGIAAHYLKPRPAILLTSLALLAWVIVQFATHAYTSLPVLIWNTLVRLILFFGMLAYGQFLSARIRSEKESREALASSRRQSHPFSHSFLQCGACGKFNADITNWLARAELIRQQAHVEAHTCICSDCLGRESSPKPSLRE